MYIVHIRLHPRTFSLENLTSTENSIETTNRRQSEFCTSTPVPLKPILRRHSVHNLAVSKNVSFDLERNDIFTISPNEKMSSPSADMHVVNGIAINRTPYRAHFDSPSTETQDENENTVKPLKHNECSDEIVNDADDDGVAISLPAEKPRKNENAVKIVEPNECSAEIEAEIEIDETSPADNASDAEFDNTNHSDDDLEIDDNDRLVRRHLRKSLPSWRKDQPAHMDAK